MILACNAWPHCSVSRVKCRRNQQSEPHQSPWTQGPEPASSSSTAAEMEIIQLSATDKRAVGTVHDSEKEDGNKESDVPGHLAEWKCACWMTMVTNGSMNPECCWKIRRAVKKVMWITDTCLNTSIECHSVHRQRRDSSLKRQVYATRSGAPTCHDAARKARAKELKHVQDRSVFDVVWPIGVKSLTKVRSKWLQDMKEDAMKARFVAQQVAYGERDDVFAGTPPLAVARTLLALPASKKPKRSQAHRIVRHHSSIRPVTNRSAHGSHSASGDCPAMSGTLAETRTVRNAQSVETLGKDPLNGLEQ